MATSVLATVSELCINEQLRSLALMVHAVLGASRQQLPILLPLQGHILGCQLTLKAATAPLFHMHILEGARKFYRDAYGQTNKWLLLLPTSYNPFRQLDAAVVLFLTPETTGTCDMKCVPDSQKYPTGRFPDLLLIFAS